MQSAFTALSSFLHSSRSRMLRDSTLILAHSGADTRTLRCEVSVIRFLRVHLLHMTAMFDAHWQRGKARLGALTVDTGAAREEGGVGTQLLLPLLLRLGSEKRRRRRHR